MKNLESFLSRQPFVLLGAFGLLSLIDNIKELPSYIGQWVNAWQSITRPIWEYTLGRLFDIPWFLSDYLTTGLLILGALIRCVSYLNYKESFLVRSREGSILIFQSSLTILSRSIVIVVFWPFTLMLPWYIARTRQNAEQVVKIYLESLVWAAILLAFAYVTLFFESRS